MGSNGIKTAVDAPISAGEPRTDGEIPTSQFIADVGPFLSAINDALGASDIRQARSLVAAEEERLRSLPEEQGAAGFSDLVTAKVRIALATGDGVAAHAILVAAIEAAPESRALRVLMSEVMLAIGRAADVRPVLRHLGQGPSDTPQERQARDTKG